MNTIDSIKNWFHQAVPAPTDKTRAVQLGCHFEEVAEMAQALDETVFSNEVSRIADEFKNLVEIAIDEATVDRKELLDALCDQIVTAIGVAHMFDMDIGGALAEVDRSNWSKFVDGKIGKGSEYKEPNLEPFA